MNSEAKSARRKSLFWRLWLRGLTVKRPQAALAAGSLLVGAAVTSMLLNLYGDVRRKMAEGFRAYGANVLILPAAHGEQSGDFAPLMDYAVAGRLAAFKERSRGLAAVPVLHVVMRLRRLPADARLPEFQNVVAVGADFAAWRAMYPGWRVEGSAGGDSAATGGCVIGSNVARRLHLKVGDSVRLEAIAEAGPVGAKRASPGASEGAFRIAAVLSTGDAEDDQVFIPLPELQRLAGLEGKVSLIELSVLGTTPEIERTVRELSSALDGVDVRPIRQIVYSEGKVLETLRGLTIALTALILVIIALCVMATMTAIVLERQKDIAVMKALGAGDRLVMRLFLSEGAALGLVGGLAGFGLGILLARRLAEQLFDVALHPVWWTLPLVCFLSVGLAALATLVPVRLVRSVQPATVLKGE